MNVRNVNKRRDDATIHLAIAQCGFLGCGEKSEDTGTDIEDTTDTSTEDPIDETADEPVDDPEDTAGNEDTPEELGKVLYEANCMGCHGEMQRVYRLLVSWIDQMKTLSMPFKMERVHASISRFK